MDIYIYIYLSIYLSVYLSIYVSIYLSIYLCVQRKILQWKICHYQKYIAITKQNWKCYDFVHVINCTHKLTCVCAHTCMCNRMYLREQYASDIGKYFSSFLITPVVVGFISMFILLFKIVFFIIVNSYVKKSLLKNSFKFNTTTFKQSLFIHLIIAPMQFFWSLFK